MPGVFCFHCVGRCRSKDARIVKGLAEPRIKKNGTCTYYQFYCDSYLKGNFLGYNRCFWVWHLLPLCLNTRSLKQKKSLYS